MELVIVYSDNDDNSGGPSRLRDQTRRDTCLTLYLSNTGSLQKWQIMYRIMMIIDTTKRA